MVDKIQSLYQGRPPSIQDFDTRVPLIFSDKYEELESWTPFAFSESAKNYPGSPAYSVSTFTELCKLCVIMNKIINKVYAEKSAKKESSELWNDRETLQKELEKWSSELPDHLVYSTVQVDKGVTVPPPHVISLQYSYFHMTVRIRELTFVGPCTMCF